MHGQQDIKFKTWLHSSYGTYIQGKQVKSMEENYEFKEHLKKRYINWA
jgi:hypothetical protein